MQHLNANLRNSSEFRATRMPLPPPPALALIMTGNPILSASTAAALMSEITPSLPGTVGRPARLAWARAAALSPIRRIVSPGRSHENQPGLFDHVGKTGIFGKKPVAGMYCIGARFPGGPQDGICIEIGSCRWRRTDHLHLVRHAGGKAPGVGFARRQDGRQAQVFWRHGSLGRQFRPDWRSAVF